MLAPIKKDLENFEISLKKILEADDNFLKNDLISFMTSSAKRLRPVLVFLFSKILDIKDDAVLNIALISELIHSATLLHDDILDEEELRRNHPTFYKKYGSKLAVLEGDLLLSMALELISKTNIDILKIYSDKIKQTLSGELKQNSKLNTIIDEKNYLDKTYSKTANLFLAGLEALFCLKEINQKTRNNLINFTKNFSIAFQIKNDTNDIISDIKNGNYTLVVLYFLQENSIEELNINSNFEKYTKMALDKVDYYKNLAINYLNDIDESIYKKSLIALSNAALGNL